MKQVEFEYVKYKLCIFFLTANIQFLENDLNFNITIDS